MVTHPEPDILVCETKWALGSTTINKARGGDGIPVELFQILKDDAVKVLLSICQQIRKTQQWPQDWKRSVFIQIPKKAMPKNAQTNMTFHMFKLVLEKAKEPEVKLQTSVGLSNKQESSRKTSTVFLLTMPKSLTVWITTNCGKFFKRWGYQTT